MGLVGPRLCWWASSLPVRPVQGSLRTFSVRPRPPRRAPADVRFLFCGDRVDPGNNAALETGMIASHGLAGSAATKLGPPARRAEVLALRLDLLVSSSASEAFPLAVGEAMACGVPQRGDRYGRPWPRSSARRAAWCRRAIRRCTRDGLLRALRLDPAERASEHRPGRATEDRGSVRPGIDHRPVRSALRGAPPLASRGRELRAGPLPVFRRTRWAAEVGAASETGGRSKC